MLDSNEASAFGVKTAPFLLGLLGAVIALRWVEAVGFWGRLCAVTTGCVSAQLLSPWMLDYFAFPDKYEGALSFIIGLFSMSLIGAVMKALNDADLWALVKELISSMMSNWLRRK